MRSNFNFNRYSEQEAIFFLSDFLINVALDTFLKILHLYSNLVAAKDVLDVSEFHGFANIDRNKGRMLEFSLGSHLGWYLSSI